MPPFPWWLRRTGRGGEEEGLFFEEGLGAVDYVKAGGEGVEGFGVGQEFDAVEVVDVVAPDAGGGDAVDAVSVGDVDKVVGECAEAYLGGIVDGVGAVAAVDALDEGRTIVADSGLVVEDEVETGFVKSDGVEGGEDAYVFHLGRGGMSVAVAVDGEVVHDIDVDDAFLALEVVVDGLGGSCHRLEEGVLAVRLLEDISGVGVCAGGVYAGLTVRGGDAYALVFEHASEAAHGVALEVGEVDEEVVVGEVASDEVFGEPLGVLHGEGDGAFGVHYIDVGNLAVSALFDGTAVRLGV